MSTTLDLRDAVQRFVAGAGQPAVLDPGEEPLRLIEDHWGISEWNGRLVLQAWDERRNLSRKIVGLREQARDRLSLITERFPKAEGELKIADLASPHGVELERRASKSAFRDRFSLMLRREFAEWRLEEVSAEPNLEQSLSPSFVRGFLRKGPHGIAALAAPPGSPDCGAIVAFGLVWLSYLRRREKKTALRTLLLFLPAHLEADVVARASALDSHVLDCRIYVYDERDRAGLIDPADAGNVESSLPPARRPMVPNAEPPEFPALHGAEKVQLSDGSLSLRIKGLEFARWTAGKLTCGIARRKRCGMDTVVAMAREVARVRCEPEDGDAEARLHPLYTCYPEGWLESQVRRNPQAIDPCLLPCPLYGQVPVFAGPDRGVIDMLGVEHTGRLVLVELKATADVQLPFQAIDYWLRVRKHLEAGDFERLGYFPGLTLLRQPPRIVLAAPALEFHSTTEEILSFLRPGIEIVRVGLASDWRKELRTMFRLQGAERPSVYS